VRSACWSRGICSGCCNASDLAGDYCDSHWLCFFFFGCIKVFADLSDGCNICKPFADCGDGFTNSFNRSGCDFGDGFFNRSCNLA
jgi:hypothetical protein